ncbi:tetratricopeptide repeat (TPR)-like superfamily protein [Actinidia rufa]|uniref:Tetratricopeptide repeat (TPR)-like superfamily protein n=1 Tax=Actinidia rufa TaxID=165716 RepID=A0A7J0ETZ9_9ERIC|nr:tetratricopeptide repeat (TPR)-like superfamily protein [Actinidia rufa]
MQTSEVKSDNNKMYIRFLRRTEGVEAARKYFLDARKSPNCTYHVYVAYAMMAFCLDKDPKIAHNVFEAGLKRFMHEPGYILEYADFLSRLNDDRNIRALFERALSSLPPEESVESFRVCFHENDTMRSSFSARGRTVLVVAGIVAKTFLFQVFDLHIKCPPILFTSKPRTKALAAFFLRPTLTALHTQVWKRFTQFEQTYGDLASMLKVVLNLDAMLCVELAICGEGKDLDLERSLESGILRKVPLGSKQDKEGREKRVKKPNGKREGCRDLAFRCPSVVSRKMTSSLSWGGEVEQRRKEALSRTGEENQSALESSLQDVISRYSFMDLWPCSSKDLDHLARQEWLSNNINKKIERSALANGAAILDKGSSGMITNSNPSAKVVYPDTSRMLIYDPRQKSVPSAPGLPAVSSTLTASSVALIGGGTTNAPNEFLKATPPALLAFIANLPVVEGPAPDVDFVLSVCLQSNIPTGQTGKSATPSIQLQTGPAPSTSDLSGSSKPHPVQSGSSFKTTRDRQPGKKRDRDRQDDDETSTFQSQPLPRDMFKIRQLRKARGVASQTGSTSYGSAFSGELSGSTG